MIISTPLPPCEGIGFYASNLSKELIRKGHEVKIITRGSFRKFTKKIIDGIEIWKVPFIPIYPIHTFIHGFFVNDLIKKISTDTDVIHLHSPLVASPKSKLPKLVTVHSPIKSDVQATIEKSFLKILLDLQKPFSIFVEKKLFSEANRILSVSSGVAKLLGLYDLQSEDIGIIGNATDISFFYPKNTKIKETMYFFSVGRLAPGKGWFDLLLAARDICIKRPDVKLIVAGDGPLRTRLERLKNEMGLDGKVLFVGFVKNRKILLEYYQNSIGFIQPSHHEGMSTVLLEAMSCGLPVISTAVSGALDLIEDQVNGFLVPPHAPKALADAALRVIADPDLASCLGSRARRTIVENYSWDIISDKYIEEYEHLLAGVS